MTREEFTEKSASVLEALDDRGTVSLILDELRKGFYDEVDEKETLITERDDLKKRNEGLQEANMDLFLKLGKPATGIDDVIDEKIKKDSEPKEPELKYEELFDENGELKK